MRAAAALAWPALLLLAAAAPPSPQAAEEARQASEAAQIAARSATEQARAQAAEADRLAAARVEAATGLRATEDQLATLAERIAALQARHDAAAMAAEAAAARLAPLLPLAERLGLYPAETLLTVPAEPEQAVRGLLVLQAIAREIRGDVAALAHERTRTEEMAQALLDAHRNQAGTAARQRAEAAALDQALAEARRRRERAQDEAEQAAKQAADEAARTETLRAAIAALEASRRAAEARQLAEDARLPTPPPAPPPPAATDEPDGQAASAARPPRLASAGTEVGKAGWAMPVAGRLTRDFGAATDAGPATGATFQTPGGARVVAPCPGRVVFAGPFRSYGQLLIVQCGGGVHAVLAGLGRLDAAAGQTVQRGEPVGIMAATGGALYVEARRGGVAVDPALYLRQKG